MAKAILLVRVSTKQQDFTAQKNDLIKFATSESNGYKIDDLLYIENKESAIKLDEEHRQGLTEMKDKIEKDKSIDCVFVWEISRLGRRYDVIESIRKFLIDHKVNLKFYKEGLQLFNKDGSINHYGNLIMDVSMALAKNEMETKIARLNREKEQKTKDGKTPTGRVLFGYIINDKGYVKPDEKNADIIRHIFEWAANGKSALWIWEECYGRGYFPYKTRLRGKNYILSILSQPAYCGKEGYRTKTKYEAIISEEVFELAQQGKNARINKEKSVSKFIAYGKSIISFVYDNGKEYAMCIGHSRNSYRTCTPDTKNNVSINMNVIDHILWSEAVDLYTQYLTKQGKEAKEQLLIEKDLIETRINNQKTKIEKIKSQKARRGVRYELDEISREDYEEGVRLLNKEIQKETEKLNDYEVSLIQTTNQLNNLGKDEWANIDSQSISQLTDDKQKKEIIDSVIKHIVVSKYGTTEIGDKVYKIEIIQNVNLLYNRYYIYWSRGGKFHLFKHIIDPITDNDREIDVSTEIVRRFPSDWSLRKKSKDGLVVADPTIVD